MELTCILLLPFTITAAWIVAFFVNRRFVRLYDRVAMLLLGCCALTCYILIRSASEGTSDYLYIIFDNVETVLGLSICPLLFMYMRTVARDSNWHGWYGLLFVPGVIIGLVGTLLSIAVGWDRILEIRTDSYAAFLPAPGSVVEKMYGIVNVALFNIILEIMAVVLIGWSVFYLVRYHKHVGNYYADLEHSSVGRMRWFLVSAIVLLLTIFCLTFFISDIIGQGIGVLMAISAWLSILAWSIGYNTYNIKLNDSNLAIINDSDEVLKEKEVVIEEDVIGYKIAKWQNDERRPFCREGIIINDVAMELKVNPRELSMYVNKHYGVNFNRWINTLRIAEAKRMFSESDDVKISYVSAVCGYPDAPSFSKSFRMIEGCSPKEYKKRMSE